MNKEILKSNQSLWDHWTNLHAESEFYNLDDFKNGKSSLQNIELQEIGDKVQGKSMLHLQCHFGQDTLSWARSGAKVTGVDFSENAIQLAQSLAEELEIEAEFVCSDVFSLKENLKGKFDIIYTSYGVIFWLNDLNKWGEIIRHFLKEGGLFYIVEFHPIFGMFDENFQQLAYSYFNDELIKEMAKGSYAVPNSDFQHEEYGWQHSLSDVVNALTSNGLQIQQLNEFPYSPYPLFPDAVQRPDGNWMMEKYGEKLPLIFSILAKG